MALFETVNEGIKQAMLSRQKDRLEALRAIKSAFLLARSEKGANSVLSEEEELKIIHKLVKQRKESADIYQEQGRMDLYEKEIVEYNVINEFMPAQMDESEIREYLSKLIDEMGATSMQQMGPVMGRATKELSGRADGKAISTIVRELLG
ncbi:GatB/YqeY domain-containing protein [Bacteroidota bacterium]